MNLVKEKLLKCIEYVRLKTDFVPEVAVVLGSGLGDFAEEVQVIQRIPYEEIKGFPVSTVQGHSGQFVFGYLGNIPVVIMKGRVHYYEGYDISEVVLPIRLMRLLGAGKLILTNASGGINRDFQAGDFMLIRDQIASFIPSPLIGPNIDEWGVRFPPMEEIYDRDFMEKAKKVAKEQDILLKEGIYVQMQGPNYESPAEVNMCRVLGGDAVGMSTAIEAVAAKHMGMRILGISCITNMACGISSTPLSHKEVGEIAAKKAPEFKKLLSHVIQEL